jgi:hypothetical protein
MKLHLEDSPANYTIIQEFIAFLFEKYSKMPAIFLNSGSLDAELRDFFGRQANKKSNVT